MQRRSFIKNTAFTVGALAFLNQHSMAQLLADPAWKIKMLTDSIGMFTERGGTILFMITKKGAVVVDSQFPDTAQNLVTEIKKKTEKPFQLLINTHHHGDHSGGNIAFKGIVRHVVAHANSKINQEAVAAKQKNADKQLFPDQTFTDKWCKKIGKEKICLHYFGAGHTNGDSLVHFQHSNIVHMGDLVFNRRHPFIDKTTGADIANWVVLLEKATQTFDAKTIYVSGHAATGYETILTKDEVLLFRDYLGNLLKFTASEIQSGKATAEILKATEIPGSPQWKGDGIQRPLTAAIEELTKK
ncbi:MAG: MBL fold metallo-hydrolase [Gloeobacteraceae cyanobacterium ES-bin-316]|nr:MBL fold metallo-hydrolase [Ferruginibacter sp.]